MPSDRPRALIPKFKCLLRCILPSLFSISFRRGDGYTFLLKRAVRWIPVKIMILGQPSLFSRTRQARPGRVNRRTGGRRAAGSVAVSSVGVISAVQRSEFDSLRAVEVRETSSLQCEGEDVPVSNRNTDPLLKDSASEKASAAQTNPIEKRTVPVPISLTVCTTRKGDSKRSLLIYATGKRRQQATATNEKAPTRLGAFSLVASVCWVFLNQDLFHNFITSGLHFNFITSGKKKRRRINKKGKGSLRSCSKRGPTSLPVRKEANKKEGGSQASGKKGRCPSAFRFPTRGENLLEEGSFG
ncbi:hypothetical protein NE237_031088 [Protea cynaroides]|uniref:Uncharacterized protein n=1 Tax=Protea cynaroides TaxID=273540 RepID=A0A9Q0L1E3_9MAGN|nr:hypothetical protein NE237_031088 [Protea cynaroides]